ncbi:uncharacterized protein LOC107045270 [Diachasma alloeum]|uniref:uncharacterized protein LOC107045270 n=1 Tax=Diachasma alloeum TaxID=454923 RepID=UPI0007383844|nr:uncharacterized protein LOC107045270 [Diachasma alloeum]
MGNTPTIISRRNSSPTGNNVKRVHWGGSGLPGPPGKPILIPSFTEDSQPIIVGIRWERSCYNGGSAIIGYLVEHRRLGSPHWVRSSPGLCSFPELTLTGLEPGWRYQFRVRAQNTVGLSPTSEISDPLTVTLQRTEAAAPYFISELRNTTALENEQVEFIVHFLGTPIPKISWFKDGFEIFSSRRTKIITENGRSSLVIHQTALNDEGEIKCTAVNKAGHISTRGKLILQALPKIRLPRQYEDGLLFEKGETIKLKISIAGRPFPSVTWYHDGEIIDVDDRHIMESIDTGEYSLTILAAKRKDRGEYTMKASNKLGEDSSSFLVTVTDRPAAPGTIKIIMTLGRSVTLSWTEPEDDGGCKIGTYIVEYYRIGWNVWLKANTSRRPEATLVDLIGDSEYKFRVKAENPYGVSDPSEESDVVFIPQTRGSSSKSAPSLAGDGKFQGEQKNYRGRRLEKHNDEDDIQKSTKRTRSLTRDEGTAGPQHSQDFHLKQLQTLASRSVSVQRLGSDIALTKSSRSDSRVTFADTVFLHGEKPLEDPFIPRAKPRSKPDRNLKATYEKVNDSTAPEGALSHNSDNSSIHNYSNSNEQSKLPFSKTAIHSTISQTNTANSSVEKQYDEARNDEEFMLILYPNTDAIYIEKKYTSETDCNFENDDDLLPPPMSRSLPELFSAHHHLIEIVREAFSSTELLHERAIERFQRALAIEEANMRKDALNLENFKHGTHLSLNKLRNLHPPRVQLTTASSHFEIPTMWNKRRLSEGQVVCINTDNASIASQLTVSSDPNLVDFNSNEQPQYKIHEPLSEPTMSLRRWDDETLYSVSKNQFLKFNKTSQEELMSDNEEKLLSNKASTTEHIENEGSVNSTEKKLNIGTVALQPKSILKKRVDDVSVPSNTSIFITEVKSPDAEELFSDVTKLNDIQSKMIAATENKSWMINTSDNMELPVMSDTENDNTSLMMTAEVAQNRRKLSGKSSMAKKDPPEYKEDVEAKRAVIDLYTEIVNAYSSSPPSFSRSANYTTGESSRTTSPTRIPNNENLHNHSDFYVNDHKNFKGAITHNANTKLSESQRRSNERKSPREFGNSPIGGNNIPSRPSGMELERTSRESSTSRSSSKTRKRRGRQSSFEKIKIQKKTFKDLSMINPNEIDELENLEKQTNFKKKDELLEKITLRNPKISTINDDDINKIAEPLILRTRVKVQSIMSYITDLILFLGALYIYLFKKEIFAMPLIGLILYRRIQANLTNWIPH